MQNLRSKNATQDAMSPHLFLVAWVITSTICIPTFSEGQGEELYKRH
jgi:hypothetical protein